jgi:hypothetical protein
VDTAVRSYLDAIPSARRRRDADTMIHVMRRATGQEPYMWGNIVGFGTYHYRYDSGRQGDAPATGFAARKTATTIYLSDGVGAHVAALERLGPHTTGVACVYLKDVAVVNLDVLADIIRASYRTLTSGTYGKRAREGGSS